MVEKDAPSPAEEAEQVGDAPVVATVAGTAADADVLIAATEAGRVWGVGVRLLHVAPLAREPGEGPVEVPEIEAAARLQLRDALDTARATAPDVAFTGSVCSGSVVGELVELTRGARLLVVGRESRHGVDRLALGTVTARVVAQAACPVRVVPPGWRGRPAGRVVVGVAGSRGVLPLLGHAAAVASASGPVVLLHAWQLTGAYADVIEARTHEADRGDASRAWLEALADVVREDHPGLGVEVEVTHGDPAETLLAASADAVLITLLRPRVPVLGDYLGDVTRRLLGDCDAPVDVVPAAPAGDARRAPDAANVGTRGDDHG